MLSLQKKNNIYLQMKFLVIGHSVVDTIITSDSKFTKPGGIFYSVISLLSFLKKDDELYLCTSIDEKSAALFSIAYNKVKNDFIYKTGLIPHVHLKIQEDRERHEKYESITSNLNLKFDNINKYDGILINMITGFDIKIEQLKEIRKNYNGIIYFDVHTFSRGLDENYQREFRIIPGFNEWAECIDLIQANEMEFKTLFDMKNETEIIDELFKSGVKQVIITKAGKGAEVYINDSGKTRSLSEDALQVKVVNKVGCGDVFGAVYFYLYIKENNEERALKLANTAGGISAAYLGVNDYLNLFYDVQKRIT